MKPLLAWVCALSILTSLVVILGTAMLNSAHLGTRARSNSPGIPAIAPSAPIYHVTAYSWGCIMPHKGPEPKHPTRAADGSWPVPGLTVAADWAIHPPGSLISIEGLGSFVVTDRGRLIKGYRIDLFLKTCRAARAHGRQYLRAWGIGG